MSESLKFRPGKEGRRGGVKPLLSQPEAPRRELADDGKRERHEVSEQRDRNIRQRSQLKEVIGGSLGGRQKGRLGWEAGG